MAVSVVPYFGSNPYVYGFNIARASTTTFTVAAGGARANSTDFGIQLESSITVDVSTTGANGLSGSISALAAVTSMAVMILGDSTGALSPAALVVSTNDWATVIENLGYDSYRRIGIVLLTATTNQVAQFAQSGYGLNRMYQYGDALAVLTNGNATSETAISLSHGNGIVPPILERVQLQVAYTPNGAANIMSLTPANVTGTTAPIRIKQSAAVEGIQMVDMVIGVVDDDAEVDYKVGNAADSADVWIGGMLDSMRII